MQIADLQIRWSKYSTHNDPSGSLVFRTELKNAKRGDVTIPAPCVAPRITNGCRRRNDDCRMYRALRAAGLR
ncbi:hypothetical protein SDC9_179704 [bioreactor metagenome]|uniref:Uncharacterized protein n=1 Tax=bioreactor metagenome TaxID=1076179 RepID=A0A645GZR3_9ZZZZ